MRYLKVIGAEYKGGYKVELTFNDAKKTVVDVGAFLKRRPHPQHNKYKKLENFKKFKIESGNIVWGNNWDLVFPVEELYEGVIS